jgi:hypothetical protein
MNHKYNKNNDYTHTQYIFGSVDGFMITAQIISIIAFLISWLWIVTFIIGLISLILLQIVWCHRRSKISLFVSVGISALAGVSSITAGIVMLVVWKDQGNCSVWVLFGGGFGGYTVEDYDHCREQIWAVVAFITAALWFSTSGCILYFVGSGRYEKCEEKVVLRGAVSAGII